VHVYERQEKGAYKDQNLKGKLYDKSDVVSKYQYINIKVILDIFATVNSNIFHPTKVCLWNKNAVFLSIITMNVCGTYPPQLLIKGA
jgi:hypothetical protein